MKQRAEWDVEVTCDTTYPGRSDGGFFIARCYPHGSRRMAYMVEQGHSSSEAIARIQKRIREARDNRNGLPVSNVTTVILDRDGAAV